MAKEVRELVTLRIIAQRLKYSEGYLANNWKRILRGVTPVFLPGRRKVLYYWGEIEKWFIRPE